jgi:hypothetical protein
VLRILREDAVAVVLFWVALVIAKVAVESLMLISLIQDTIFSVQNHLAFSATLPPLSTALVFAASVQTRVDMVVLFFAWSVGMFVHQGLSFVIMSVVSDPQRPIREACAVFDVRSPQETLAVAG